MKTFIKNLSDNKFISPIIHGFKKIASGFNFIINLIVLSVVYFLGVGLTWLVAKIMKKHFLDMRPTKDKSTYWSDLNPVSAKIDDYYRQF